MTKKWRPLMALMYMTCCLADFFLFPIMFTVVQFWETQAANDAFRQWVPITLQGGGLFHVAMGAVLGVSAYGRTQEKLGGAAGSPGTPMGTPAVQLTNATPQPTMGGATFGATPTGFSPSPTSFGAPAAGPTYASTPAWGTPAPSSNFGAAPVTTGFGGKLAPPQPEFYPER